jgi:hypothetical protein
MNHRQSMKKLLKYQILAVSAIVSGLVSAHAATVTVTKPDGATGIPVGDAGTFYWALTNCQPGDTIAFDIDTNTYGPGPFYLQEPLTGFPILYQKHRVTIDGYTQPGASPNSNPITSSNNAVIQIVIDGRSSAGGVPHARNLNYSAYDGTLATSDPPIQNQPWNGGAKPSYGSGDYALLAIYRSTNVTIKGLAFLGDDCGVVIASSLANSLYGIALMHDYGGAATNDVRDFLDYPEGEVRNCHVCGCWFGVNPTNVTKSGITWIYADWIDFPRHAGDDGWADQNSPPLRPNLPNVGLTVGVAKGATDPRSEFNVLVGGFAELGGEGMRLRISGNFIGFMPDGVTPVDPQVDMPNGNGYAPYAAPYWADYSGTAVGCGRFGEHSIHSITNWQPMVIGTDGDGTNDADEGNLWGPLSIDPAGGTYPSQLGWYRSSSNLFLIAGNRVAIGNDGHVWTNSAFFMSGIYMTDSRDGNTRFIIGSDFATNRSPATIAAQANYFYNNLPISIFGNPPSTLSGIVPFFQYDHPQFPGEVWTPKSWVTLRGNVMAGNGLAPYNYADYYFTLVNAFTNCFGNFMDTNAAIIPTLDAGSSQFPSLVGTFAPGIGDFTNVTIDVYQLDPYGWTNGQAFDFPELEVGGVTNGFPQGKKYLGSYPVANTGNFNIALPASADLGAGIIVTANYSKEPAGTPWAENMTSDFSNPIFWPVMTMSQSGSFLNISWDAANGAYTVQTNSSVVSPGTWGNFTGGNVMPPVNVPIGSGTLFVRLKKL